MAAEHSAVELLL